MQTLQGIWTIAGTLGRVLDTVGGRPHGRAPIAYTFDPSRLVRLLHSSCTGSLAVAEPVLSVAWEPPSDKGPALAGFSANLQV